MGLIGYYGMFIKGYKSIAAPLTQLLRKNGCKWTNAAMEGFQQLKEVVTNPSVLGHVRFEKKLRILSMV